MSSKSTIILTPDNEHWHHECLAHWNYGIDVEGDECIVLEFDSQHLLEVEDDGTFSVMVRPDSHLGKALFIELMGRKK